MSVHPEAFQEMMVMKTMVGRAADERNGDTEA